MMTRKTAHVPISAVMMPHSLLVLLWGYIRIRRLGKMLPSSGAACYDVLMMDYKVIKAAKRERVEHAKQEQGPHNCASFCFLLYTIVHDCIHPSMYLFLAWDECQFMPILDSFTR